MISWSTQAKFINYSDWIKVLNFRGFWLILKIQKLSNQQIKN